MLAVFITVIRELLRGITAFVIFLDTKRDARKLINNELEALDASRKVRRRLRRRILRRSKEKIKEEHKKINYQSILFEIKDAKKCSLIFCILALVLGILGVTGILAFFLLYVGLGLSVLFLSFFFYKRAELKRLEGIRSVRS